MSLVFQFGSLDEPGLNPQEAMNSDVDRSMTSHTPKRGRTGWEIFSPYEDIPGFVPFGPPGARTHLNGSSLILRSVNQWSITKSLTTASRVGSNGSLRQNLRMLDHPNLVRLYEVNEDAEALKTGGTGESVVSTHWTWNINEMKQQVKHTLVG